MSIPRLNVADLFCGAGGTSTGMVMAFEKAGVPYHLVGVNHWKVAISTSSLNHKGDYVCAPVEGVEPTDLVKGGVLDILWASPECTNHSRAKGGMPRQNQSRCQAESLLPWIRKLIVRRVYVENVPEFLKWGPLLEKDTVIDGRLYKAGTPDPRHRGDFFKDWVRSVKVSGYDVEWRLLNAADYGAPTSRERIIVQAVRKRLGEHIVWPEPTYSETGKDGKRKWVPASSIIDWSIKGRSIFERKKPLADNTIRRIENGIRRYWGEWAEPFLVVLRGTSETAIKGTALDMKEPLPAITAGGGHIAVVEPFLTQFHGGDGGDRRNGTTDGPVPTVDCANRHGVVRGFIVDLAHTKNDVKPRSMDEPLPTLTCTHGNYGVACPMFIPQQSAGSVKPAEDNPLPTISTTGSISVVQPLIQAYYSGNDGCKPADKPLDTVPTKGRFGLVDGRIVKMPDGTRYKLDITFRMLQPHELAAAMSFPDDYKFTGNKTEQIRQIGNAVCPKLSEALIMAALKDRNIV